MRVKDIVSKFIAEGEAPYYITMQGGKPMVKSGNGLTPVEPSKLWFELTPDVETKALSQGFRKISISSAGSIIAGLEGGGKIIVSPKDFQKLSATKTSDAGATDGEVGFGIPPQHPMAEELPTSTNKPSNMGDKPWGKSGDPEKDIGAADVKPWGKSGDPEKDIGAADAKLRGKTGDPEKDIGPPAELATALTQLKNILKKYNVTTESRNNLKRRMISENLHEFSPAEQIRIFTILVENKPEQLNEFIAPLIKGLGRMFRMGPGATAGARTAARTTAQSLARRSLAFKARNPIRAALPKIGGAALTGWGAYEGGKALWDWWNNTEEKPEDKPTGGVAGFDGGAEAGAGAGADGGGVAQAIQSGVLSKEDVDTIKKQLPVLVRYFGLTTTSADLKLDIKATIDGIEDLKDKAMSGQLPAIVGAVGAAGAAGAAGGQTGSTAGPNSDPEDPKTWPAGVKPAPDFGYLDPNGMWIPTPFHVRNGVGNWIIPAQLRQQLTRPMLIKLQKIESKFISNGGCAVEQQKSIKLPDGAPTIPGYKQVDASQFSKNGDEGAVNVNMDWVYAYRKQGMLSKDFILIAPQLYYNTKLSTGRHYRTWNHPGIKTSNERIPSKNGTVFSANQSFNVNDMILVVVVNTSIGAGNIGPQILQSISGSLTPVKG